MGLSAFKRPVVLIVEDEFLLRMDAVDMIAAAGFEVVEAGDADEAIDILESRRDITVVFTDIQMPGSMDGLKLARAVRGVARAPATRTQSVPARVSCQRHAARVFIRISPRRDREERTKVRKATANR